jgi:hypothetical protein
MSIFGKAVKSVVGLAATGADFVITKTSHGIEHKFGENEMVKTVSEIGSGTVRVTETTVKTMTDVVDGGIEAGLGYLSKDDERKSNGLQQAKTAGKDFVSGVGKGIVYTAASGARTASSAFTAGKHLVNGDKELARQEINHTKDCAIQLGKTVAVGLLAFGPPPGAAKIDEEINEEFINNEVNIDDAEKS